MGDLHNSQGLPPGMTRAAVLMPVDQYAQLCAVAQRLGRDPAELLGRLIERGAAAENEEADNCVVVDNLQTGLRITSSGPITAENAPMRQWLADTFGPAGEVG